jgi:hypothetical protein
MLPDRPSQNYATQDRAPQTEGLFDFVSDVGTAIYKGVGAAKDAVVDTVYDGYVELKKYYNKDVRLVDSPSFKKIVENGGNYLASIGMHPSNVAEWFGALDVFDVAGAALHDASQDPPLDRTALGKLFSDAIRKVQPSWALASVEGYGNNAARYVYSRLKGQSLFSPKEINFVEVIKALKPFMADKVYAVWVKRLQDQTDPCVVLDPDQWPARENKRQKDQAETDAEIKATLDKLTADKWKAYKEAQIAQTQKWDTFRQTTAASLQMKLTQVQIDQQSKVLTQLEAMSAADLKAQEDEAELYSRKLRNTVFSCLAVLGTYFAIQMLPKADRRR